MFLLGIGHAPLGYIRVRHLHYERWFQCLTGWWVCCPGESPMGKERCTLAGTSARYWCWRLPVPTRAPLWWFWSEFWQKLPSESWLNPISMVICDTKMCKLGGSGIPWRGSCRRDDVATQLCSVGPEAFPPQRQQLDLCISPSGNEVVVQPPGVHITETTAGASVLPRPHRHAKGSQQNTDG